MMAFLWSLGSFLLAIGVLVVVHEFGHFWVARRLGVKVLRFSIGFGRPLWTKTIGSDRLELVVAAVPFGGYVKMLDEREGEVPQAELHRAFNRQPILRRAAIVAAGPFANFLFAIIAYTAMFLVGITGLLPVVGQVDAGSRAEQAGFASGDRWLRIDGKEVQTWESAILALLDSGLTRGQATVTVETAGGAEVLRRIDLSDNKLLLDEGPLLERLGIHPRRPQARPVIAGVAPDSPAERGGLRAGDRLVAADGIPVEDWDGWVAQVRKSPGVEIAVEIEREGVRKTLRVIPQRSGDGEEAIGRVGAWPEIDREEAESLRSVVRYGPFAAVIRSVERTWEMTALTLRLMLRLVTGDASLKNLSGPIGIAEYAGVSAAIGLSAFLGFLGIVSVSLGVLNLLPIPVLDGGHLLYYCIEAVKGSPLSERAEELGTRIGLALIAALMMLALYNDLVRIVAR